MCDANKVMNSEKFIDLNANVINVNSLNFVLDLVIV